MERVGLLLDDLGDGVEIARVHLHRHDLAAQHRVRGKTMLHACQTRGCRGVEGPGPLGDVWPRREWARARSRGGAEEGVFTMPMSPMSLRWRVSSMLVLYGTMTWVPTRPSLLTT